VVHGSRTESGKPILANDTHLGLGMPSTWYENALHGGRFDVIGFSMPAMPTVVIGHNGSIAWGITSMATDVQDLYRERLDDPANPTRYELRGESRELAVVEEEIPVKGGEAVRHRVLATHHGPLINDLFESLKGGEPLALAWTALAGTTLFRALIDLDLASDWESFHGALSHWQAPALSFVYADVDGNIGYQAAGRHPLRAAGHDGRSPVAGWTGELDWQGSIPYEEMPRDLNPPAGFLAAANNKVIGGEYPYPLTHDWADPRRERRLTEVLTESARLSLADTRRLAADTHSLLAEDLRLYLLAAEPGSDLERRALEELRSWDLADEPDRVGATIFYTWQWRLLRRLVADELGESLYAEYERIPLQEFSIAVEMVADPTNPWFDDRSTPEAEGRDQVVQKSFEDTVAWLAERLGPDPGTWNWGRLHSITFVHAPLGQSGIGPLEAIFNSDTLPARGGPFTVNAGTPSFARPFAVVSGPSQRFIADLADLESSLAVNSTGQSAHVFHRHREDQVRMWQEVQYHPLHFDRGRLEVEAVLTLAPE
jgi:penicillin amidase